MAKCYLTNEGLTRLKNRLSDLECELRPAAMKLMDEARSYGDLSENAEYSSAKAKIRDIDREITQIKIYLADYQIITRKDKYSHVELGCFVKVLNVDNDKEITYQILGTVEANPDIKVISNECPLGKALMGHSVGDEVEFGEGSNAHTYEILEIK